jgi:hypothetical protein
MAISCAVRRWSDKVPARAMAGQLCCRLAVWSSPIRAAAGLYQRARTSWSWLRSQEPQHGGHHLAQRLERKPPGPRGHPCCVVAPSTSTSSRPCRLEAPRACGLESIGGTMANRVAERSASGSKSGVPRPASRRRQRRARAASAPQMSQVAPRLTQQSESGYDGAQGRISAGASPIKPGRASSPALPGGLKPVAQRQRVPSGLQQFAG